MPAPLLSPAGSPQPSPLFQHLRDRIAQALRAAASGGLPALADALDEAAEGALDGRDRQALFAAAMRLRREAADRVEEVERAFERRVQRCLEAAHEPTGALELVDDDELEQQIAAGELAREAREQVGAVYPRYVARLRRLLGASFSWDDDERNPLGARTMAAALLAGVAGAAEGDRARDRLRHLAWKRFAEPMADAIDAAERFLARMGVSDEALDGASDERPSPPAEPSGRGSDEERWREAGGPDSRAATRVSGRAPAIEPSVATAAAEPGAASATVEPGAVSATAEPSAAPAAAPSAGSADEGVDARPPEPARPIDLAARAERDAATLGTSPLAGEPSGPRLRALPTLQPVLDLERDAVAFAHSIGAMPYSREARAKFFGNVRTRLREAGASSAQLAIVDVVAAMFDYVIDERRVPEAVRPLVWRLQQPTLSLALLDPGYLGDEPRSLRRLIEHLGAISSAFADEITRGSELHRRLETVVRAVEIVTSALQARSAVMAQQVQKEYARAARNVGQLVEHVVRERRTLEETPGRRNRRDYARRPSREREEEVTGQLHAMLAERLRKHPAPESVRDFLMNVWLRHLRTAALRDGEESAEFQVSMRVVDDLLWSLDESGERHSRRELAQRIPPLIRLMTQGVREIGAKDEEFKAFFDELFLIHLRRMQRRDRERGATRTRTSDADASDTTIVASASPATSGGGVPETAPAPQTIPDPPTEAQAEEPGRRLLEILESLDLDDLPVAPRRLSLDPDVAIARLARGDWVELVARDGSSGHSKVAWINRRRTVVLLVRRADRRAMSLRADELRERLARGRAYLVER